MTANPMFYQNIVALSSEAHKKLKKDPRANYAFAAKTNSVPITTGEFIRGARDYPVVFAGSGEDMHAVAVVGLANEENLYVDEAGDWDPSKYIPGYVRRHPFILARQKDGDDFAVCIDDACPGFNEKRGARLFDKDGGQTDYLKRILDFVKEYQQDLERSRLFAKALEDKGLLEEVNADVALKVGTKYRLAGLRVVSRRKLNALDERTCHEFLQNGYLEHIYLHLSSLVNFTDLVERLAERHPEAEVRTA